VTIHPALVLLVGALFVPLFKGKAFKPVPGEVRAHIDRNAQGQDVPKKTTNREVIEILTISLAVISSFFVCLVLFKGKAEKMPHPRVIVTKNGNLLKNRVIPSENG